MSGVSSRIVPGSGQEASREESLDRVTWALRRADLAMQAAKEPPLRAVGVPSSQYQVLINLETAPGITAAELARLVGITPQAVALLTAKLLEQGLIERRAHPRHRTVQELHLTEAGRTELGKAERIISDLERHVRDSLGTQRYKQLRALLGQVIEDLPKWSPPTPRQ
jgi:DNA-binding MarR family transcriptional regulator